MAMLSDKDIAEEGEPKDEDIHMEIPLSPQPSTSNFKTPTTDGKQQQILPNRL